MYTLFLAFRFLSRRFINGLAILGVMVAVTALIVVPSVMRGFEREIRSRIRGTLAHVIIKGGANDKGLPVHRNVPPEPLTLLGRGGR